MHTCHRNVGGGKDNTVYSPKINETRVRQLYRLRKLQMRPMTHVVADALDIYLAQQEAQVEDTYVLTDRGREFLSRMRLAG